MKRRIGRIGELAEGEGVLFEAVVRGEDRGCFLVKHEGCAYAYMNVCAHRNQPVVVDANACDRDGLVECRAHGAKYVPETGECVEGPCVGAHLVPIALEIVDGEVWAVDDDVVDDSIYED